MSVRHDVIGSVLLFSIILIRLSPLCLMFRISPGLSFKLISLTSLQRIFFLPLALGKIFAFVTVKLNNMTGSSIDMKSRTLKNILYIYILLLESRHCTLEKH